MFLFLCCFCFVCAFSFEGLTKIALTHRFIQTACNCLHRFSPLVPLLTSSAFNSHRQYCTWVRDFRTICWWAWFSQTGQRKMQKTIRCWSKFPMKILSHYPSQLYFFQIISQSSGCLWKLFPLKCSLVPLEEQFWFYIDLKTAWLHSFERHFSLKFTQANGPIPCYCLIWRHAMCT